MSELRNFKLPENDDKGVELPITQPYKFIVCITPSDVEINAIGELPDGLGVTAVQNEGKITLTVNNRMPIDTCLTFSINNARGSIREKVVHCPAKKILTFYFYTPKPKR